jgi:c-di-GMP phosphodiesterase
MMDTMSEKLSNSVVEVSESYSYSQQYDTFYHKSEKHIFTKKQHQLLKLLVQNMGSFVNEEQIREFVWGKEYVDDSTIRSLIKRTRVMLKEDMIETRRGYGYTISKRESAKSIDDLPGLKQLLNELDKKAHEYSVLLVKIDNLQNIKKFLGLKYSDAYFDELLGMLKNMYSGYAMVKFYKIEFDEIALLVKNDKELAGDMSKEIVEIGKSFYTSLDNLYISSSFTIGLYTGSNNVFQKAASMLETALHSHVSIVVGDIEALHVNVKQDNIDRFAIFSNSVYSDTLRPYFQPILNNKTGEVDKYECLARISDSDKILSPDAFLSIASLVHGTSIMTKSIIRKAFEYFENKPETLGFSINLDVPALEDDSIFKYIDYWQSKTHINPTRVTFEILETVNLFEHDVFKKAVKNLKQRGYKIAIDDFGTGYSNFVHLIEQDIDYIKIDGSFIAKLDTSPKLYKIVSQLDKLIKICGARSIAEHVTSEKIQKILCDIGIDYSQGYFVGKPDFEIVGAHSLLAKA